MRIRWYGQSAFLLTGEKTVMIDPFGPLGEQAAARGLAFDYPPIDPVEADVLLITHEHADHSAADRVTGTPFVVRSTAGIFESPAGEIAAIASEHDDVAGTARGPNTIFRFTLDGLRVCHLGDLGQPTLRPEQASAIGVIDVLLVPAGGGPTVGGEAAAQVVRALRPRLVIPMHYRTAAVNFLDPPDAFLEALGADVREVDNDVDTTGLPGDPDSPTVAMIAAPVPA